MQSTGTDQYNTSNSQQPHNHPTPQSPPGLYSASSGFNSSMSSNMAKITSPQNNPPIIAPSNSLPTPRSPNVDTHLAGNSDDAMDIESASDPSRKRRRGSADIGDDDRPRKSRSRSRDPNTMDIDLEQSTDLVVPPVQRSLRTVPTVQELLDMPSTGPPSWLNQKKHRPSKPALTSSLLDVYGLQAIAASVARTDPVTGEKKKLRKSYKGKISGLSGKNEVVTTQQQMVVPEGQEGWGQPMLQLVKGGLLEMLDIPEEEWRNQKVIGKELPKPGAPGGRQLDLNVLRKGFSNWTKGPIPDFDASWLALDDPPSRSNNSVTHHSTANNASSHQSVAIKTGTPAASGTPNGINTVSPDARDPRGVSRKRQRAFENGSWAGYGEEYDEEGSGYDDEEGRKKKKKKRKYDDPVGGGVGMNMPVNRAVGVGVGGGYYQR